MRKRKWNTYRLQLQAGVLAGEILSSGNLHGANIYELASNFSESLVTCATSDFYEFLLEDINGEAVTMLAEAIRESAEEHGYRVEGDILIREEEDD